MESYRPGARGCLVLDLLWVSACSREFFLVTVACEGQDLGFHSRGSGYCNRCYLNKDELEFESGVFKVALLLLPIIPSSDVGTQLLLITQQLNPQTGEIPLSISGNLAAWYWWAWLQIV